MTKLFVLSLLFVLMFSPVFSHEGHKHTEKHETLQESIHSTQGEKLTTNQFEGRPERWLHWIGSFHFIFLHFPIALIVMTAISELLFAWYKLPIFNYSSRFMLISGAILAVPTALLGLIYSYTATYNGLLADFIWWHMWTGMTTAIFAIIVVNLREFYGTTKLYYTCFLLLFLLIIITGFLGGGMTFGPYYMIPPLS